METWVQRLGGGKNTKFFYYASSYTRRLLPRRWLMWRRRQILNRLRRRPDYADLKRRVDYYCGFSSASLPQEAPKVGGRQKFGYCASVYLLDSEEIRRYFPKELRWQMTPGDNVVAHDSPMIVKSRPIGDKPGFDVLLKLNRVRHFTFPHDRLDLEQKKAMAVFRGEIEGKLNRWEFLRRFAGSDLVDAGCVDKSDGMDPRWHRKKMTLYEHFRYRYIVCLEGNDVASCLKWAMNSNSVVMMPRPKFETWFMEGLLQPDVHYVCVKDDYSDVEEKILYYNSHPEEARIISENAGKWTSQFKDGKLERDLGVAVMHNFMVRTGQLDEPEF